MTSHLRKWGNARKLWTTSLSSEISEPLCKKMRKCYTGYGLAIASINLVKSRSLKFQTFCPCAIFSQHGSEDTQAQTNYMLSSLRPPRERSRSTLNPSTNKHESPTTTTASSYSSPAPIHSFIFPSGGDREMERKSSEFSASEFSDQTSVNESVEGYYEDDLHSDTNSTTRIKLQFIRPRWVEDSSVTNCAVCNAAFSLLRRKVSPASFALSGFQFAQTVVRHKYSIIVEVRNPFYSSYFYFPHTFFGNSMRENYLF